MHDATMRHIRLALSTDPEVDEDMKKKIFFLLKGKSTRRRLINTRQACDILDHCHPITLRRLEKRGHLKAIRLSARKIRWDADEIQHFADFGIESPSRQGVRND